MKYWSQARAIPMVPKPEVESAYWASPTTCLRDRLVLAIHQRR